MLAFSILCLCWCIVLLLRITKAHRRRIEDLGDGVEFLMHDYLERTAPFGSDALHGSEPGPLPRWPQ
jgi:hypothetical protein